MAMSWSMSRMLGSSTWNDWTQYCNPAVSSPVAPPNCSRRSWAKRALGSSTLTSPISAFW